MPNNKFIRSGLREALSARRLIIFLWLISLCGGLLIVLPFRTALTEGFGYNLAGKQLASGFNLALITDFLHHYSAQGKMMFNLAFWVGMLFIFLYTFLNGGIIAYFVGQKSPPFLVSFLQNCGKYWGRFLRLFLLSGLSLVVLLFPLMKLINTIARAITKNSSNEGYIIWTRLTGYLLIYLAFLWLAMVFDYAKIRLIIDGSKKSFRAVLKSFGFVFRNFWQTVRIYFSLVILGWILFLVYVFIVLNAPAPLSAPVFWLIVIFQQLYLMSRLWIKLSIYSSQVSLFKARSEIPSRAGQLIAEIILPPAIAKASVETFSESMKKDKLISDPFPPEAKPPDSVSPSQSAPAPDVGD